jgi:hypothetical protein
MDSNRLERLTRKLSARVNASTERRTLLRGARFLGAAAVGASMAPGESGAKNKRKKKSKKALCLSNGIHCKKAGKKCKAKNCLATPFTIEARWSNPASDHDTYLFVPHDIGSDVPSPYIDADCQSETGEAMRYPFAFVSQEAEGPGDEITTIAFLLDGTYEYWIKLEESTAAGDLTVILRSASGRVLRIWSSPENAIPDDRGWHVFNIQGRTRSITSIDEVINGKPPGSVHDPYTDVCP